MSFKSVTTCNTQKGEKWQFTTNTISAMRRVVVKLHIFDRILTPGTQVKKKQDITFQYQKLTVSSLIHPISSLSSRYVGFSSQCLSVVAASNISVIFKSSTPRYRVLLFLGSCQSYLPVPGWCLVVVSAGTSNSSLAWWISLITY